MPGLFNKELDSILLAWLNLSTENSNLRPIYLPAFAFFGIEEITEKQCANRYSSLVRGFNSRYGKDTNAARLTAETLRKEGSFVLKLAPVMEELICEKMERLKELDRQNLPPHLIGTKRARSTAQKRTINQVEEQKSSSISAKRRAKPASPQLAVVIKTGPDSANRRLIESEKTIRIMAVQLQQKDLEIQNKA
ncbi:hypothetical protein HYALB_00006447 [Hymenoscyphus albidus]|uniref:Uncharacterized protein n=1 Tax=Hymenoscyphus albidus TaxID=595503 RepID=A0A9N9LIX1_9HELO|nr:hypothetical protein HYALB_00006447 [Hymenoscyphus albidus]